MSAVEVETVEEAEALPSGQWVQDATGQAYCLIDTYLGFPQRMAAHKRTLTNLSTLAYPLHLADFVGDCEHKWGTHELGQCIRCGQVVAEPRPVYFDADQMAVFRADAEANARHDCTCYPTDPKTWTRYGSAVEPGSTLAPNPDCPVHFPATQPH